MELPTCCVLEYFSCQETNRKAEYMGANDFGLPQDVISVVCIAKYRGNVPPKITCEWFSGTKLLDNYQRVAETNLTTTLIILVPAGKEFNGDQLSCNVNTDGTNIANQTQIEWKSSRIVVNCKHCHFYNNSMNCVVLVHYLLQFV